jgi:hypothetical protein
MKQGVRELQRLGYVFRNEIQCDAAQQKCYLRIEEVWWAECVVRAGVEGG